MVDKREEKNQQKLDEAKKNLRKKSIKVFRLFSSPEGEEVLKILEQEFDHRDPRGVDIQDTYYRLGQRDVMVYIRQHLNNIRREQDED